CDPELTEGVAAPAEQFPLGRNAAGGSTPFGLERVGSTAGHEDAPAAIADDLRGRRPREVRMDPELAVPVASPAPGLAGLVDPVGLVPARRDALEPYRRDHGDGRAFEREVDRSRAELPLAVPAPAESVSIRSQAARVLAAGHNRLEAMIPGNGLRQRRILRGVRAAVAKDWRISPAVRLAPDLDRAREK